MAPSETSEGASTSDPQLLSRGNLIKQVGERAGMAHNETADDWWLSFTVTNIEGAPQRATSYADSPERGHFIVFDLEAETSPTRVEDLENIGHWTDSINFHPSSFDLIDGEGYSVYEGDFLAAYGCLDGDWQIAPELEPGEKARGKMVFDSPTKDGVIVYSLDGGSGWEF